MVKEKDFKRKHVTWIDFISSEKVESLLDFRSFCLFYSKQYFLIEENFELFTDSNLMNNELEGRLLKHLEKPYSPDVLINFLDCICNTVYVKNINTNWMKVQQIYEKWFEKHEEFFTMNTNVEVTLLIENYLNNFQNSKFFSLRQLITFICRASNILFSLKENSHIFSFLLDAKTQLNNIFIPGANEKINDPYYRAYCLLIENSDANGNPTMAIWKCSCSYPYPIGECGKPMEIKPCPECGLMIGGIKHEPVSRQGHERIVMTAFKARENLSKLYENEPPGYHPAHFGDLHSAFKVDCRSLSPLAYRLLHLIFHGTIYLMKEIGLLNDLELNNLLQFDALWFLEFIKLKVVTIKLSNSSIVFP